MRPIRRYLHTTTTREFKQLDAKQVPPGNGGFADFVAIGVKMLLFEGCWDRQVSIDEAIRRNNHEIRRYIKKYNSTVVSG